MSWLDRLLSLMPGWRPARPAIPDALWQDTLARLPVFAHLDAGQRERLRTLSESFLADKEFTGAGGLELRDEMLVQVAAQACLLVLELGLSAYRGWVGIIIYPDEFIIPRRWTDPDGITHEYLDQVAGEAWEDGPVIISWRDNEMAEAGYNVVIHEFAHKLDMLNGATDGIPALHSGIDYEEWERVLLASYEDFCDRLDRDEEVALDPYAAEHPSEFFAVASECFFTDPDWLEQAYPDFHALLKRYYRQDPGRLPAPA